MTAVTVGAISTKGRPALRWHGEGFQRRRHHHPREEPCADAPCRAVPTEPAPPPMQPPPPPVWLLPPGTEQEFMMATVTGPAIGDAARADRLAVNLKRIPAGAIQHKESKYGRTEYTVTLDPDQLATYSDTDLVDLADLGLGHFGGSVDRGPAAGTATITVWVD